MKEKSFITLIPGQPIIPDGDEGVPRDKGKEIHKKEKNHLLKTFW
jgi:hypothetical protein